MFKTIKFKWMAMASLVAFASCSDDTAVPSSVGEEYNAIALTMGVDNSLGSGSSNTLKRQGATRADGATDSYVSLTTGTGIRLRMEGVWTSGSATREIIKTSHAAAGTPSTGATYNPVSGYTPMLYWDDFGAADPDNKANTDKGLDIYAVAIDGLTTAPELADNAWGDATTDSNLLSWNTVDNSADLLLNKDLIVANNLSGDGNPGRLTFEEHKAIRKGESTADPLQARLVFRHVLSKITFNLKAAEGFTDYKFAGTPVVTLTRSKSSASTKEYYCYVEGNVNVKKSVATPTGDLVAVTPKKTGESLSGTNQVIKEEAIVYPGSIVCTSSTDIVAMINADNNLYYITAAEIKKAIDDAFPTEDAATRYLTKAGYNYVFNVTVNKTGINVTATVVDWNNLSAEEEPKIDVTANVGESGSTATIDAFSFYRMADETTGANRKYNLSFKSGDYYGEEAHATLSATGECTFVTPDGSATTNLYWPDHQTHYHFRGVYPQTSTSASVSDKPLVVDEATTGNQAIKVANCKYNASTFPSNLMIGAPEIAAGTMCGNEDHINGAGPVDMSVHGVCAREGKVNLNFRYMMSQVEVKLVTTTGSDKVDISGSTKVEIENARTDGWIGLDSRAVDKYGTTADYLLNNTTTDASCLLRHDCIVPQNLAGLTFKISILDADGNVSAIYRATISDIKVKETDSDGTATGDAHTITAWESGKKYTYTLTLRKTKVSVTATITDWTTKTADSDIWL